MEHVRWNMDKYYDIANPNTKMLFWAVQMGQCHKLGATISDVRLFVLVKFN